uniref:Uncharacterized protein n=1 Tax=Arundo donax TaxID=35708 RepID=A0A0A9FE18_ARUDO
MSGILNDRSTEPVYDVCDICIVLLCVKFLETVGVQRLARIRHVEVMPAQPCTIASLYSCG